MSVLPQDPYYVRPDGGSFEQCTGLSDKPYPGSGAQRDCAFKHLFELLPPGGEARFAGGSEIRIASGNYRMGYTQGVYHHDPCSNLWPEACFMSPVPSGPSARQPTRILGQSWDQQCANAPVLEGVERSKRIINLEGTSHVDLRCLEITDRSACTSDHLHGLSSPDSWGYEIYQTKRQACNNVIDKNAVSPIGPWAHGGIYATDGEDLIFKDLNIHGLSSYGIHAGRLTDLLLEGVRIVGNGKVGYDGDVDVERYDSDSGGWIKVKDSRNSGDIVMRGVEISWNGCIEQLDGSIKGCWGQDAGGYGDGIGTDSTGGHWVIEDSDISFNTSDGVDFLYVDTGDVSIARTRAIGNAGNQFKLSGRSLLLENSIAISNCAHFKGQPYEAATNLCRAGGVTVSLSMREDNSRAAMFNNYLSGNGDGLVGFGRANDAQLTSQNSLTLVNNIFDGDDEYHSPGDVSFYLYSQNNGDQQYHIYNNQIGGKIKFSDNFPDCASGGTGNVCADAKLSFSDNHLKTGLKVLPENPGQAQGLAVDQQINGWLIPKYDFDGLLRPHTEYADIGPFERDGVVDLAPAASGGASEASSSSASDDSDDASGSSGISSSRSSAKLSGSTGAGALIPLAAIDNRSEITPQLGQQPPAKGEARIDPTTGAKITRLTDSADLDGSDDALIVYSRYSPENSAGDKVLVFGANSTSSWVVDRAGKVLVALKHTSGVSIGEVHEPRWDISGNHPNRLYYVYGTGFYRIDQVGSKSQQTTLIRDFGAEFPNSTKIFNDVEGDSSNDSDHWGWMASHYDSVEKKTKIDGYLSYQISTNTLYTLRPDDLASTNLAAEVGRDVFSYRPNMVEISPTASGFVMHHGRKWDDSAYGFNGKDWIGTWYDGAWLWPLDFDFKRQPPVKISVGETHSGWAFDRDGREMFISQNNRTDKLDAVYTSGTNAGYEHRTEIANHADFGWSAGFHFGKMPASRAGWVFVNTYANRNKSSYNSDWGTDQLLMLQLSALVNNDPEHPASPSIWRIAPNYNLYLGNYRNEAPAAINRLGNRIYFSANWGGQLSHREVFMVELPNDWDQQLAQ